MICVNRGVNLYRGIVTIMRAKDQLTLAVVGGIVFLLTVAAFLKDYNAEWKTYQGEFLTMASEKLGAEKVGNIPTGIRQIWNPDLKLVDRCTTCHMGIDIPGFEDAPQPYTTHPDLAFWDKTHPIKDFGCTTCHSGQGYALNTNDGHGHMKHWQYPMFTKEMADTYGFKKTGEMMETNCNVCHRRDEQTPRMPNINLAKNLVKERGCIACHILDGKNGGSIGPELTYEGSKHGEVFTMTGVEGEHTVLQWHMEHFQNPSKISKGSVMPPVAFTPEEARALGLLVMSWKKTVIPMKYLPNPLTMQGKVAGTEESAE